MFIRIKFSWSYCHHLGHLGGIIVQLPPSNFSLPVIYSHFILLYGVYEHIFFLNIVYVLLLSSQHDMTQYEYICIIVPCQQTICLHLSQILVTEDEKLKVKLCLYFLILSYNTRNVNNENFISLSTFTPLWKQHQNCVELHRQIDTISL